MTKVSKKTTGEKRVSKTYNKEDLVEAIVKTSEEGISKLGAKKAIADFFRGVKEIAKDMKPGDKIQLVGDLTLECYTYKAREGHNPRNPKQKINIPAKNKLKITAGKSIADLIQQ